MKTILTFLLTLTILSSFISQDSYSQDKKKTFVKKHNNNIKATFDVNRISRNKLIKHINNDYNDAARLPVIQTYSPNVTRTASVSGNWSNTATWGGQPVPLSADAVIINQGINVIVDVPASCISLTFANITASNSSLTLNGTNSLNISGNVLMPRPSSGLTCTINVNAGTLSCGSLTMSATTVSSGTMTDIINITTGTASVSGLFATGSTGCRILITAAGTLNLNGPRGTSNPVISTVAGSTVNIGVGNFAANQFTAMTLPAGSNLNYTGSVDQLVYDTDYLGNLGFSGTGTKIIDASTVVTVHGNLNNSSALVLTDGSSSVTTMLVMEGNVTNTGSVNSTGSNTEFVFSSANAQTFINNGTIISPVASFEVSNTNASGLTLSGTNGFDVQRINLFTGKVTNSNKITIGIGGTTNATVQRGIVSNTTPAGSFDVSPNFNVGSDGLILLYDNGSVPYSTGFEIPGTSTCNLFYLYDGADVTLNTNLTVADELNFYGGTGSPSLRIGPNTLTIGGAVTYNVTGAFYGGTTSNLVMNGSNKLNTIINGLNNFTVNNSGGVSLLGAVTTNGTLTLTNGFLSNGTFLTMANGSTVSRTANGYLLNPPAFAGTVNLIYTGSTPVTSGPEMPTAASSIINLTTNTGGVTENSIPNGGTVSTLYSQGFNAAPADWSTEIVTDNGSAITPAITYVTSSTSTNPTVTPTEGTKCVEFNSFDCDPDSQIRLKKSSAPLSTTGKTNISVVFDWYMDDGFTNTDNVTVQWSTNGTTWNNSSTYYRYSATNGWVTNSCLLPPGAENQPALYIAFLFTGEFGNNCHLDNLKLNITTPGTPLPRTTTINGTLFLNGNYNVGSGNTLAMANNSTIDRSNGTLSAAPVFGSSVNVTYSGSTAITTGIEIPVSATVLNNLTINNSAGVTLSADATLKGTAALSNGLLKTDIHTLNFGTTAVNPVEKASSRIVGTSVMGFRTVGTGSIYFLNCNIAGGSDNLGNVKITRITGPGGAVTYNGNTGVQSNWDIQSTNPITTSRNLTFEWLSAYDPVPPFITGDLADMFFSSDNGTTWNLSGNPVDPTAYAGSPLRGIAVTTTHFSKWTVGRNDAPLPVLLSSFTSSPIGRNVNLNWITASEINNSGFNVERMIESGVSWEKIGFVQGKGTVNIPTDYSFSDINLQSGKYKYRLKQVDVNGNFKYYSLNGDVIINLPDKYNLSQNYPNPFNPSTKIDFDLPFDSKVHIVLYDMTGREIKTLVNDYRNAGFHTLQFNASDLSTGIYLYRIEATSASKNFVMTKKMALLK